MPLLVPRPNSFQGRLADSSGRSAPVARGLVQAADRSLGCRDIDAGPARRRRPARRSRSVEEHEYTLGLDAVGEPLLQMLLD